MTDKDEGKADDTAGAKDSGATGAADDKAERASATDTSAADEATWGRQANVETQSEPEAESDSEAQSDADALTGAAAQSEPESSSEPETPSESEPAAEPDVAAAKPRGRGLAILALLVGLMGVGAAGYLYYQLVWLAPLASLQQQNEDKLAEAQNDAARLAQQLQQLASDNTAALAAAQSEQRKVLGEYEVSVRKSLQEALLAAPPSQREWKLAEAEYLMRIANHRALLEQDSDGALTLLQAADQILAELDDFALHGVRARLADEVIALKQVPKSDLQGLYLRLEALKSQLGSVVMRNPEPTPQASVEADAPSLLAELGAAMKDLVRVRTLQGDETLKPLLSSTEEDYLELNMRLAMEQAQLAALKRHQVVYEQALQSLREWLAQYADERAAVLLEEIDELMQVNLIRPLPDVSGSLNELLQARRGGE